MCIRDRRERECVCLFIHIQIVIVACQMLKAAITIQLLKVMALSSTRTHKRCICKGYSLHKTESILYNSEIK